MWRPPLIKLRPPDNKVAAARQLVQLVKNIVWHYPAAVMEACNFLKSMKKVIPNFNPNYRVKSGKKIRPKINIIDV